jgi:MFS-type transporter involved in bile tolerance (Atg22 family)
MIAGLQEVMRDKDKSAIRLLLAIFFWFVGYNAIEAFFTLYSVNHLGLNEADGAGMLGHLSLFFVLFALIAGVIGSRMGRRVTISLGLILLTVLITGMFLMGPETLVTPLTTLPVLGTVRVISLFLMTAGIAWALININSLPMVVDMVALARVGTYTGLYYLFSTLAAIAGPNINGLIIQISGENYNSIMLMAPVFMVVALILMWGVRRGEAVVVERDLAS